MRYITMDIQIRGNNNWLYIYYISGDCVIYERSMPRTCTRQADDRIKELRKRGTECFYIIGRTLPGAFY